MMDEHIDEENVNEDDEDFNTKLANEENTNVDKNMNVKKKLIGKEFDVMAMKMEVTFLLFSDIF